MRRIVRCLVVTGALFLALVLTPQRVDAEGCWWCGSYSGQCTFCADGAFFGAFDCIPTCQGGCWMQGDGYCAYVYHNMDVNPAGTVLAAVGMRLSSPSEVGGPIVRNCRGHILSRAYSTTEIDRRDQELKVLIL